MSVQVISSTNFQDIKLFKRGKVRDVYDLDEKLLIVSTDRISCFDVILPTPIPHKAEVLTEISAFWFKFTKNIISNHFITDNVDVFPQNLQKYRQILSGRSMLVKKTQALPVECIVRGYLSGSGWKEYQKTGSVCGIRLPNGLKESDKLPEVIFTPSTKEKTGHDVNVTQEYIGGEIGKDVAQKLKDASIALYKKAAEYAETKGIIIADTKFEFGKFGNEIILIDEIITPDSSRFWPKDRYKPGKSQPSFDKQFVRDYLETLDWDKTPPAPQLPQDIVTKTTQKYLQVVAILTNKEF